MVKNKESHNDMKSQRKDRHISATDRPSGVQAHGPPAQALAHTAIEHRHQVKSHQKSSEHEYGHLPLHEQIKRQLASKKNQIRKKETRGNKGHKTISVKGHGHHILGAVGTVASKPKDATNAVAEKKPKEEAVETSVHSDRDYATMHILTYFEITMMNRVEIDERKEGISLKITGFYGLDKKLPIKKRELSIFLRGTLPKKINSMDFGDSLEIVGMEMEELEELFRTSIPVEPKGEIEVSEKDDGKKVSIFIRISGSSEPLFNYSAPGLDEVKRVVERQKFSLMSPARQNPQEPVAQEKESKVDDSSGDWLQEQLDQQRRDVAALAKELGEKVAQSPSPEGPPGNQVEPASDKPAPETTPQEESAKKEINESAPPKQAETSQVNGTDMAEFMEAYKEEAATYVEILRRIPQLKENPNNSELISDIHRSAHSLKSISTAMGFSNISKISKALEALFLSYKKTGAVDMEKYDIAKEAVDKVESLYNDLVNSEKISVEEVVKKVESVTIS